MAYYWFLDVRKLKDKSKHVTAKVTVTRRKKLPKETAVTAQGAVW